MGRFTWIKIYCENWLRGSIRQEPPEIRGIWVDLLTLAGDSAYGDVGEIKLADKLGLTDKQLCQLLNITDDLLQKAKKRLIETERIKIDNDNVIIIINWQKYQSEYQRIRKYTKKNTTKNTTKHTEKHTTKNTGKNTEKGNKEIEIEIEKKKKIERKIEKKNKKKKTTDKKNIYTDENFEKQLKNAEIEVVNE